MTQTVSVTRRFDATPEQVFDAWLDPKIAAKFLFATATGEIVKVEIEPEVGSGFLIVDKRPDVGEASHYGTYLEIDRPRRLVFDFSVEAYGKDTTRVTVEIRPAGDGCELILTHEDVGAEYAERAMGGWTMILEGLAKTLG